MNILFCLPGKSFSGDFLQSWTDLLSYCFKTGIQVFYKNEYDCNVYYVRNKCLGGNVLHGKNQKPFNGNIDYDYIMWIDSDIVFSVNDFATLLARAQDIRADILTGLYLMEDRKHYAAVEDWNEDYFKKNGRFEFLTDDLIAKRKEPFEIGYSGLGFMLVKKGVFESLEYPWFRALDKQIDDMHDFTSEDVAFCLLAKEKGYKVFVDPAIIVGHRKTVMI